MWSPPRFYAYAVKSAQACTAADPHIPPWVLPMRVAVRCLGAFHQNAPLLPRGCDLFEPYPIYIARAESLLSTGTLG